jgi:hypothetical protein
MTATMTNGRSRKSLADQIDRLDSVLDGLADGLNEAVATAVKEAVRAVLTEVLTNPELLARLAPAPRTAAPKPVAPSESWLARAWAGVRSALRWTVEHFGVCRLRTTQACGSVRDRVAETARRFRDRAARMLVASVAVMFRTRWLLAPILTAAALAGLTGIAAYQLGPWIAAAVSGAGGLGSALGRPASGAWLRWVWPWRLSA